MLLNYTMKPNLISKKLKELIYSEDIEIDDIIQIERNEAGEIMRFYYPAAINNASLEKITVAQCIIFIRDNIGVKKEDL